MKNTDDVIIKRVLKGDSQAFEELVLMHQKNIYNVCLRFMKNEQDALDMAQEAFVSIYNNLDKFKFKSRFSTWIYRFCVNACLNELKKRQRLHIFNTGEQTGSCSSAEPEELPDLTQCDNPQEILELKEARNLIEKELSNMGKQAGMIMRLRLFGHKKFSEIAGMLGIPDSTARTGFVRARKRLQESLSYYNKDGE